MKRALGVDRRKRDGTVVSFPGGRRPRPEPTPGPGDFPRRDVWNRPYQTFLDWSAAQWPDDLEAAFHELCSYARMFVCMERFRTWALDSRHRREALTLRALAALDVDEFFRRHPSGEGDRSEPLPFRDIADG
jgi:hypothetical protein